jgi:hypothetical protein
MAIPQNKQQLLDAIKGNYQKLRTDLVNIDHMDATRKELEGHAKGSVMSVCNLVAYLAGWGVLVLKWNRQKDAGIPVHFPETGYKWNELGKLAQKFYNDYSTLSYTNLINKLDEVVADILLLVESKNEKQLYGIPWYDNWTLGRMIQLNTSSPYLNARNRIRSWKRTKGIK